MGGGGGGGGGITLPTFKGKIAFLQYIYYLIVGYIVLAILAKVKSVLVDELVRLIIHSTWHREYKINPCVYVHPFRKYKAPS